MLGAISVRKFSSFVENLFGNQIIKKTPKKLYFVILAVAVCVASHKIIAMRKKRNRLEYSRKRKDIVILHQFPRGTVIPSISPFVLKLETYLRMSKIPYENDFSDWSGPKGKCPYITLNGEDIGDSQLIIEFLNKKFNINLSSKLSSEEKSIARAFRIMAEDHLFWPIALYRWIYDNNHSISKISSWPYCMRLFGPVISRIIRKEAHGHGIGRHTKDEVMDMAINDILALSIYLGNKKYFMGNEPTEVDCAIFGFLAQLIYVPIPEIENLINADMKNIKEYCQRMKERFWPDWN